MKLASFQTSALYLLTSPEFSSPLEIFQLELLVNSHDYTKSVIALHAKPQSNQRRYKVEKFENILNTDHTHARKITLEKKTCRTTNFPKIFSCLGIAMLIPFCLKRRWRIEPTSISKEKNQLVISSHEPSHSEACPLSNEKKAKKVDTFLLPSVDLFLALRKIASQQPNPESGHSTFTWHQSKGPRLVTDLKDKIGKQVDFGFPIKAGTEREPMLEISARIDCDNKRLGKKMHLDAGMNVQINFGRSASDVPYVVYSVLDSMFNDIKKESDDEKPKNCYDMYRDMPSFQIEIDQSPYEFTSEEYVVEISKNR
uniref:AlNc14C27G2653 protein n=1 Tax=Albugo laibachii Nc14 TaxID=890382 RepID=F0W724_9STRA|nr:AlNc14C27G2653 [Albugo laibachii Nc14]|eukprot:CCA16923.1 AlNc14C27G2653 [Albugo laibachii Nc14]